MKLSKYTIVGVSFFIMLFVAFNFTIIEKENTSKIFPYRMKLYYPEAEGLSPRTEVSVLGIPMGQIESVRKVEVREVPDRRFLSDGQEEAVELTIILKRPLTLWENYTIKFKAVTVFSGRTIDIDPGSFRGEESNFTPTYNRESEAPDFAPSARYYDDFFGSTYELFDENKTDLRTITRNVRQVTDKLNSSKKGTLPLFINSDIAYNNIDETFSDLALVAREGRRYVEGNRQMDIVLIPLVLSSTMNLFQLNILSQGKK